MWECVAWAARCSPHLCLRRAAAGTDPWARAACISLQPGPNPCHWMRTVVGVWAWRPCRAPFQLHAAYVHEARRENEQCRPVSDFQGLTSKASAACPVAGWIGDEEFCCSGWSDVVAAGRTTRRRRQEQGSHDDPGVWRMSG